MISTGASPGPEDAPLVAVDVGNTHVVLGLFDGPRLVFERRLRATPQRTADELTLLLRELLDGNTVAGQGAVLGSVVPSLTEPLALALERIVGAPPLVVTTDLPVGMPTEYEDPRALGVDRFVNALAGYERAKGAVIVVDLGTATKLECVSERGVYLGGAIAPGLRVSAELLTGAAARLSSVQLTRPATVVGKTTTASLQSGLVLGWAAMIEGLVERTKAELGVPCRVIATGGLCRVVASDVRSFDEVVPELTLEGLRLVWLRTRPA